MVNLLGLLILLLVVLALIRIFAYERDYLELLLSGAVLGLLAVLLRSRDLPTVVVGLAALAGGLVLLVALRLWARGTRRDE
jgi:hypothetical protein